MNKVMLKQPFRNMLVVTSLLAALSGCASGPSLSEMSSTIQVPASGQGRIFIYRSSVFGAAIQPSVRVDGVVVGDAVPDGFFYVDRPAGDHKISASTEVERDLSLTLASGQTRYVRLAVSMGFFAGHISPELVDDTEGAKDVTSLHYTGK